MTDTSLAKRKPNELRELLEGSDFRLQLTKALPKTMSPERFVRITLTSTMRNPKLLNTTRDTFFRCLLELSAMGLEPDGRQAHLIPRKNKHTNVIECTIVLDYKGIKELLYRHGDIVDEHSDVVGDLDEFSYEFGTNKHLRHIPHTEDRGKIYCAYSFISLPKGGNTFDVMSTAEIEAIRKRSSQPDGDPWTRDWAEMAKKTVFKRLSKSLPLSPRTRDALEIDNSYEIAEPAAPPVRAVVGGGRKSRDLPPGPEDTGPEPGDELAGEGPTEPSSAPTSPHEPVQAAGNVEKPPGPLTRVRGLLKEAGFEPAELLAVLKSVRLADKKVADLSYVTSNALEKALDDWENVIIRLNAERERAAAAAAKPQDDFPA